MLRVRTAVACGLFVLLAGCVGMPRPVYPQTDAGVALARREATSDGLLAIRAEARVDQRGRAGRVRGTVLMFVERAGRVRFDVMTQFGPVAILTSDRQRFAFADLRENRYLTGDTCPANIARLLGVPLSVEDTARFLLAGTPLIAFQRSSVSWNSAGFYRVVLNEQAQASAPTGQRQELDLAIYPEDIKLPASAQRLYLLRSELYSPQGKRVWRVTYEDEQAVSLGQKRVLVPQRVHVEQPASGSDTLIHFKQITFNPQIPEQAFVQEPRPGMQIEEASCE